MNQDPQQVLRERLNAFELSGLDEEVFTVSYDWLPEYLDNPTPQKLLATFCFARQSGVVRLGVSVQEAPAIGESDDASLPAAQDIQAWARNQGQPWFWLDSPITLQPVFIPKPWGQEIWYTGIEERGQSRVSDGNYSIPLPWLLSACGEVCLAKPGGKFDKVPLLLKVLDPLPEPVFGDLYFELHEEKREVYVVTNVDRQAWPNGQGGIRFGFAESKRSDFVSDEAFTAAYLDSVKSYRSIREKIDSQVDEMRKSEGVGINEPVTAEKSQAWLARLSSDLLQQESESRAEMETFIHIEPLKVGDVVKVPTLTPHSLMHGVRTIEFQTPVYERKILSFAQKVLTQSHWDTESAMSMADLSPASLPSLPVSSESDERKIESVVEFQDFSVERITLAAGKRVSIEADASYRLLITVADSLLLQGKMLESEQAELFPAGAGPLIIQNSASADAVFLLAKPH